MSDIGNPEMSDITNHPMQFMDSTCTSDHKMYHQLMTIEEEQEAWNSFTRLEIPNVCCPITKVKLLTNFPKNYTYQLFVNGHECCKSQLINDCQTFDFSMEDKILRIFQDVTEINTSIPMTNEKYLISRIHNKYEILNFSRLDLLHIDVINPDPYDSFHIYNPITKKFKSDEYEIEVEGFRNDTQELFTEKLKLYPSRTLCLPVHFMVESIEILDPIATHIMTEYGDLYPDKNNIFKFTNTEFTKYSYSNMVDFKHLQHFHSQEKMNTRIMACIPNTKHLNFQTLNFSRLDSVRLVTDKPIERVKFKVKYYNLKIKIEENDGSVKEGLVFTC